LLRTARIWCDFNNWRSGGHHLGQSVGLCCIYSAEKGDVPFLNRSNHTFWTFKNQKPAALDKNDVQNPLHNTNNINITMEY
jgi:hypothetical protein